MACDHLDKRTFDNAMEKIKEDYYMIWGIFNGRLANSMKSYYQGWQSVKGFNRINDFYEKIAKSLTSASNLIVKNYSTMREGGIEYARSQDMLLIVGELEKRTFEMTKQEFSEEREIIVDETTLTSAGTEMKATLKEIVARLDSSVEITSTDEKFGYYSDDRNPRMSLHLAYKGLKTDLEDASTKFFEDFDKELEDDKRLRDDRKQASTVESNNFADIF